MQKKAAELKKEEDKKMKQQIKNTEDSIKRIKTAVPLNKITSN